MSVCCDYYSLGCCSLDNLIDEILSYGVVRFQLGLHDKNTIKPTPTGLILIKLQSNKDLLTQMEKIGITETKLYRWYQEGGKYFGELYEMLGYVYDVDVITQVDALFEAYTLFRKCCVYPTKKL